MNEEELKTLEKLLTKFRNFAPDEEGYFIIESVRIHANDELMRMEDEERSEGGITQMNLKEKIKKECPKEWNEVRNIQRCIDSGMHINPETYSQLYWKKACILDGLIDEERSEG